MAKPLQLKSTKVDVSILRSSSTSHNKARFKFDSELMVVKKTVVSDLVADYDALLKAVRKTGLKIERPLHYNETPEWKAAMKKGISEEDMPAFLRKGKPVTEERKPEKAKRKPKKRVKL